MRLIRFGIYGQILTKILLPALYFPSLSLVDSECTLCHKLAPANYSDVHLSSEARVLVEFFDKYTETGTSNYFDVLCDRKRDVLEMP